MDGRFHGLIWWPWRGRRHQVCAALWIWDSRHPCVGGRRALRPSGLGTGVRRRVVQRRVQIRATIRFKDSWRRCVDGRRALRASNLRDVVIRCGEVADPGFLQIDVRNLVPFDTGIFPGCPILLQQHDWPRTYWMHGCIRVPINFFLWR